MTNPPIFHHIKHSAQGGTRWSDPSRTVLGRRMHPARRIQPTIWRNVRRFDTARRLWHSVVRGHWPSAGPTAIGGFAHFFGRCPIIGRRLGHQTSSGRSVYELSRGIVRHHWHTKYVVTQWIRKGMCFEWFDGKRWTVDCWGIWINIIECTIG